MIHLHIVNFVLTKNNTWAVRSGDRSVGVTRAMGFRDLKRQRWGLHDQDGCSQGFFLLGIFFRIQIFFGKPRGVVAGYTLKKTRPFFGAFCDHWFPLGRQLNPYFCWGSWGGHDGIEPKSRALVGLELSSEVIHLEARIWTNVRGDGVVWTIVFLGTTYCGWKKMGKMQIHKWCKDDMWCNVNSMEYW